jgi:hypothetical protein
MRGPAPINWPLSSFPGNTTHEAAGRLINCTAEPLGEGGPAKAAYHRQPGLSQFAATTQSGYRGGLIVNNLSYEAWFGQAATVNATGAPSSLGSLPGFKKISIARNQNAVPDVVAVDIDNGAYILSTSPLAVATGTATIGGAIFVSGDTVALTFNNVAVPDFPVTVIYTLGSSETAATVAAGLANLIVSNAKLSDNNLSATAAGNVLTITQDGNIGNTTTLASVVTMIGLATRLSSAVTGTGNETVTIVPGHGTATVTIGGTSFKNNDTVSLTFSNPENPAFPVIITSNVLATSTPTSIATDLTSKINANATLVAAGVSASNTGAVITLLQPIGDETVTLSGSTLSGGAGVPGIVFTGAPLNYTGNGRLPQPNSVCFQDGYFFFTIADGRVFASGINQLTQNSLTYITAQSRSDVTLLRGVAYSGLLFLFSTGHCEVWGDAGNVAPNFPYSRQAVLPYGLLQANAIAGFETGFDDLSWVAQDFGVWELPYGQLQPTKTSPPDLDRLIEAEHRAGNILEASVYMFGGKKFWVIQSPDWTWEYNLSTQKWNERWSLNMGLQGRWRGTGGHPAFGKWLLGDVQGGTLCFIDDHNYTELGAPMLLRLESAPVIDFPNRIRVARADFDFTLGVGTFAIPTPTVAISWSDDGGVRWGVPLLRSLGPQGVSKKIRVSIKHAGLTGAQGRRWRIDFSDPINAPFMGATQSDDPRRF